ncbi:MAG: phosphate ABC transporter ATP-binding protein [Candidatus Dormibacteraeota bacterium]|nr:phosphate ABC transporter ATP-binding protein [Candidatus Dormibacteraeota bacterium]MBV9526149.1 phosphate ABC transporter ATP-binding protein [Candidatus Dormibacteraeota bacterium]
MSAAAVVNQPEPQSDVQSGGLAVEGLSAWFGGHKVVEDVSFTAPPRRVTALIGPSGCGKSTVIRCINRMHELVPGARMQGRVLFDGSNIYDPAVDAGSVRSEIGMVFQRPNPFPTKSIFENTVIGVRLARTAGGRNLRDIAEQALHRAHLWDEVKDRLNKPAVSLSGGQQQRLCIARAIAVDPALLLMDEPCSALDPIATFAIEELIGEITDQYTVVIVTHNMQQATRVSHHTGFMTIEHAGEPGKLVEFGTTDQIFGAPKLPATEAYVSGRVG